MTNRSLTITILIVGVLNACAILGGFYLLHLTVEKKILPSSSTSVSHDNVVPLSNGRFAVVQSYRISVYRVDEQNRISRLNEVDTSEQTLQPVERPNYHRRSYTTH